MHQATCELGLAVPRAPHVWHGESRTDTLLQTQAAMLPQDTLSCLTTACAMQTLCDVSIPCASHISLLEAFATRTLTQCAVVTARLVCVHLVPL